jgi:hypothetical protein
VVDQYDLTLCCNTTRHTRKIGSNVDRICKVKTEDNSLLLVWCANAFALRELRLQVVACEDATENATNPCLSKVSLLPRS